MYSILTRIIIGIFALIATIISTYMLYIFVYLFVHAKPFILIIYGTITSILFTLIPFLLIETIIGTKMHYPNADDWGHIQVAAAINYYAFYCAFQSHQDTPIKFNNIKRKYSCLSPGYLSSDNIFFMTLGLTTSTAHLWTMSLSGNDSDGEIFHVKTGAVLFFSGIAHYIYSSQIMAKYCRCCTSNNNNDISNKSYNNDEKEERNCVDKKISAASLPNPVIAFACLLIGSLFYMNHHQPNLYSKKLHNYYSALIIIFGVVRSFATIRLSYYTPCLLCRAKGVVKQCSFMYTRSVAITYSDHCKIRHRRDYGNTSNVSCSFPLEWLSSLVMLWSGCIFLFSSRHILSFASYRFPIVEIYVFVIGISAFFLLMGYTLILTLTQSYFMMDVDKNPIKHYHVVDVDDVSV